MHHTKAKGDIGLTKVIADLTTKGLVPCIPLSEHQPYDIVAIGKDGMAYKFQVKYASLKDNGTIDVRFRRCWADKNGTHIGHYAEEEFDYYAIYCPKVIRFEKTANNQTQSVKWFKDYLRLERESSETIRHTPEKVKT